MAVTALEYANHPIVQGVRLATPEGLRAVIREVISTSEGGLPKLQHPITLSTPLFDTVQRKTEDECIEIAEILTQEFPVCDPLQEDSIKQSVIFYAAREGKPRFITWLLGHGLQANSLDAMRQTPLFYASREGQTECIRLLLQAGADPNSVDINGQTCLYYACRDNRIDAVKLLLQSGADTTKKDNMRKTAYHFAKAQNHVLICELLRGAQSPAPAAPPDMEKRKYRLQFKFEGDVAELQSKGLLRGEIWLDAGPLQVSEFENKFPDTVTWEKGATVPPPSADTDGFLKLWYPAAHSLIHSMSKYTGGSLFEKPVDARFAPGYYDIIKNPMSFSCMKGKIKRREYIDPQDIVDDADLIFKNCEIYNKVDSHCATIGKAIHNFFKKQIVHTSFDSFLRMHKVITAARGIPLPPPTQTTQTNQPNQPPQYSNNNDS